MRIVVGSKNQAKVTAVAEILKEYPHLVKAEVLVSDVLSGVANQPKSLDETIQGAMNRAKAAQGDAEYGVGIESGLMQVPHTKGGYMDICIAAIRDKEGRFHIGISSAWEFPDPSITKMMVEEGLDMSQAINKAGLTKNPNIGAAEGAIGILTKGKVDRKEYTKQALRMALIHIDEHTF